MSAAHRAVVTGLGVLSPIGCDWPTFADAVRAGRSAPTAPFPGAQPDDAVHCQLLSDPESIGEELKQQEPLSAFAIAAVRQALDGAGIEAGDGFLDDVGLVMSTTLGPATAVEAFLERLASAGPRAARPALFVDTLLSMPASRVGIALRLRGSTAVVGGSSSLELALDWVRNGREHTVVAGGGECQAPKCLRYYQALAARSGRPRARPAQGAAFAVIEDLSHAQTRRAAPLAELLGAGAASEPQATPLPWSADAEGRALACAMRSALSEAGLAPEHISTVALAAADDASEANERAALSAVFGEHAGSLDLLRPKRLLGEPLSTGGPLGLLAAIAALEERAGALALVNAFELGGGATSILARVGAP